MIAAWAVYDHNDRTILPTLRIEYATAFQTPAVAMFLADCENADRRTMEAMQALIKAT